MFDDDGNRIPTPMIDSVARYLQLKDFEGDQSAADERWMEDYEPDSYKETYRKDARAIINIILSKTLT